MKVSVKANIGKGLGGRVNLSLDLCICFSTHTSYKDILLRHKTQLVALESTTVSTYDVFFLNGTRNNGGADQNGGS